MPNKAEMRAAKTMPIRIKPLVEEKRNLKPFGYPLHHTSPGLILTT
jgi:hypothetical protein